MFLLTVCVISLLMSVLCTSTQPSIVFNAKLMMPRRGLRALTMCSSNSQFSCFYFQFESRVLICCLVMLLVQLFFLSVFCWIIVIIADSDYLNAFSRFIHGITPSFRFYYYSQWFFFKTFQGYVYEIMEQGFKNIF